MTETANPNLVSELTLSPRQAARELRAIAHRLPAAEFGRAAELIVTARALEEAEADREACEKTLAAGGGAL